MRIEGPETRKCPADITERITRLFGNNEFGDPLFKIVWGQSQFIRMGNVWRDKNGTERVQYQERYQCHKMPCWVIMRWKSPLEYGSPQAYYSQTFDSLSKLYITGEYPWKGRYEVMQPLIRREMVNGQLEVEHFPISHYLVDMIIPLMLAWQVLSEEQKAAARQAAKAAEDKAETEEIAEKMMANLPTHWGPTVYGVSGISTSVLDKKAAAIQKVWDAMSKLGRRPIFQKGMAIGKTAPRVQ